MNPETTVFVENKILEIIDNLDNMEDCGKASKVIDAFEKMTKNKKTVKDFREYLCDKTFEIYTMIYGKRKVNTKVKTTFGSKEIEIDLLK